MTFSERGLVWLLRVAFSALAASADWPAVAAVAAVMALSVWVAAWRYSVRVRYAKTGGLNM